MLKKYTCIICPNGCEIEEEVLDGEIKSVSGFTCKRGEEYVRQEILAPKRTIASSVAVKNGELPVTSVRITKAVPKELIPEVMKEIKKQAVTAPVEAGTVLISNICGTDSDVICTKTVREKR